MRGQLLYTSLNNYFVNNVVEHKFNHNYQDGLQNEISIKNPLKRLRFCNVLLFSQNQKPVFCS